jgi:hypothetical protein
MWYCYPPEDQREPALPEGTTVSVDMESGEPGLSAKALACSKATMASTGPGSEYWLP